MGDVVIRATALGDVRYDESASVYVTPLDPDCAAVRSLVRAVEGPAGQAVARGQGPVAFQCVVIPLLRMTCDARRQQRARLRCLNVAESGFTRALLQKPRENAGWQSSRILGLI
jgi:hypothetical protein